MVQKVAPASPPSSFLTSIVSNRIVQLGLASIAVYLVVRFVRSLRGRAADQTAMKFYDQGITSLKKGDRVAALIAFQQAERAQARDPNLRARIFLRMGEDFQADDNQKAIAQFTRAISSRPSDKSLLIEALISRAQSYMHSKREIEAAIDLTAAMNNSPTESERIEISLYQRLVNQNFANPEEVKLSAKDPKRRKICILLIEITQLCMSNKKWALANIYLQNALNALPASNNGYLHAVVLYIQGHIFLAYSQIPEAIASFEKAQQCEHTEQDLKSKIATELNRLKTPALSFAAQPRGVSTASVEQPREAPAPASAVEPRGASNALAVEPRSAPVAAVPKDSTQEAEQLVDEGFEYLKSRKIGMAQAKLENARMLNPRDPNLQLKIYVGLGNIQWMERQYQSALKFFQIAERIAPRDLVLKQRILICKGQEHSQKSEFRSAIDTFTEAMKCSCSDVEKAWIKLRMSHVHCSANNFKAASTICQEALQLFTGCDTQMCELLLDLTAVCTEKKQINEAKRYLGWACERLPENNSWVRYHVHYKRALLLSEEKEYQECSNELKIALDNLPDESSRCNVLIQLGYVDIALGNKAGAKEYFQQALVHAILDDDKAEITAQLEKLNTE